MPALLPITSPRSLLKRRRPLQLWLSLAIPSTRIMVSTRKRTKVDHLSTFALDVDTASYAEARLYIQQGSLPPYEAVRAEEFVNAFDQGYQTPADAVFAVFVDGGPNPFADDGTYFLRVGVQGNHVRYYERKPLVLTLVVDVSGSMREGGRLELLKNSLKLLLNHLDSRDTVTIVAYDTSASLVLGPTTGSDTRKIESVIDRLRPGGTTNAEAGLSLGFDYARQTYNPEGSNRVILLSDGVANTGATSPDGLLNLVSSSIAEGIDLSTIGVGMGNYNDVLLEQLADRGNGNYHYVNDMDEAQKLFVDDMTANLQTIAYDAKAQMDFNTDVVAEYRLVGYENRAISDQAFRQDTADGGEIGAGHTATAVYQVKLRPGAEGRIGTIQVRWQDADTREVKEINGNFNTWDLYPSFAEGDPHFQMAVLAAQFAEVLRASPYAQASLGRSPAFQNRVSSLLQEDEAVLEFAPPHA